MHSNISHHFFDWFAGNQELSEEFSWHHLPRFSNQYYDYNFYTMLLA